MKRQIKFRGKDRRTGKWVYGDLLTPITGCKIVNYTEVDNGAMKRADYDYHDVLDDTVGQFIGLHDRNGKEVYEGDIITVDGLYPRVVLWNKVSWALMPCEHYQDKLFWVMNLQHPSNDWWELFFDKIKVVGNVHDNPELMK